MTGINVGSQKEAGIQGPGRDAGLETAFAIHRQQVTVIKCFFISSQATTKAQNRIKQSGGMLALLKLRPFENVLAMRGSGMLQARIREQRDAEIWSAVWEPSSSCSYLHAQRSLRRFLGHHIRGSATSQVHQRLGPSARGVSHRAGAERVGGP